jgi:hypothetical protein
LQRPLFSGSRCRGDGPESGRERHDRADRRTWDGGDLGRREAVRVRDSGRLSCAGANAGEATQDDVRGDVDVVGDVVGAEDDDGEAGDLAGRDEGEPSAGRARRAAEKAYAPPRG